MSNRWACSRCGRERDGEGLETSSGTSGRFGYCPGCGGQNELFNPVVTGDGSGTALPPAPADGYVPEEEEHTTAWDAAQRRSGAEEKAAGMARAESSARDGIDEGWRQLARETALALASKGLEFTSNDLTEAVGLPMHRNAVGALLSGLAREGVIRKTGYRQGDRASQHARVVAVWRGVS